MPQEKQVMEKNSSTHTAHSDTNAVLMRLATCRSVKGRSRFRYSPGRRDTTPMTIPASDQKNRRLPSNIPAVACTNAGSSSISRPFSFNRT